MRRVTSFKPQSRAVRSFLLWVLDTLGLGLLCRLLYRRPRIVLYHGVTDEKSTGIFNYRNKFVSSRAFKRQLAWMKKHYTVLPLADFISKMERGALPRNALAITFDDGYANNYWYAYPLLKEVGLSATFFITTGFIEGTPLPVDVIEHAIGTTAKNSLTLALRKGEYTFMLRTQAERITTDTRLRTYSKTLTTQQRELFLRELVVKTECDLSTTLHNSPYQPLTWAQIKEMEEGGMTFAPHTVTHPILSRLSGEEARREIADSTTALQSHITKPLRMFAYPNGGAHDYSPETVSILKAKGFIAALTTRPSRVTFPIDTYELPRYTLDGTNELYRFRLKISGAYDSFIGLA